MRFDQPPPEPLASAPGFLLSWNGQRAAHTFAEALKPLGLRPPLRRPDPDRDAAGQHPTGPRGRFDDRPQLDGGGDRRARGARPRGAPAAPERQAKARRLPDRVRRRDAGEGRAKRPCRRPRSSWRRSTSTNATAFERCSESWPASATPRDQACFNAWRGLTTGRSSGSIRSRRCSMNGGRESFSPRLSSGSSIANPGPPKVASSKRTPLGSRK